jgi:hypothetical protein
VRDDGSVDSVQWVLLPPGVQPDPLVVEQAYHAWGGRLCAHLLGPHYPGEPADGLRIGFHPKAWACLISLGPLEGDPARSRRAIQGGLLARPGGHLAFEFEPRHGGTVLTVAVRGLRPRMPARLYQIVQRQMHERATFAFLRQCVRQLQGNTPT